MAARFRRFHHLPWRRLPIRVNIYQTEYTYGSQIRNLASIVPKEHRFHVLSHLPQRPNSKPEPRLQDGKIQIFSDVSDHYVDVPNIWLRDHCHCSRCFHEITKQRIIETFDEIPEGIDIKNNGVHEDHTGYHVEWMDGHQSYYHKDWLAKSGLKSENRVADRHAFLAPVFWEGHSVRENPPSVPYSEIMQSDEGVRKWLAKIKIFGFSYVDGCPSTPKASEELLERISFVRNTHYGGFYDFTADLSSGDTAYTQLGIGAHTDNTYFTDPAGLQMFHLLSHKDGEGGSSQLVDGFGAANQLLQEDFEAYDTLSRVGVYSHASGGLDISIQPVQAFPVLNHDPQAGFLTQVRWNTTDRATIDMPIESVSKWYDAARKWTTILRKHEYWEQLEPGRPLVFDNWRVLHGRSAFTGNRRICGGYINRDDWISRLKVLSYGRDTVLCQVARG